MIMRCPPRTTELLAATLIAGLLTACTDTKGQSYPNSTDLGRAQAVWADPWVAPEIARLVEPQGKDDIVRTVATRDYHGGASQRALVATEVRAAQTVGWRLIGATCRPDEEGDPGDAMAQVAHGEAEGDVRVATIEADFAGSALATGVTSDVSVEVAIPHHRDARWSLPAPIDLADSCLVKAAIPPPSGGADVMRPTPSLVPEPSPERKEASDIDPPTWADGPIPKDLRDAVRELRTNRGILALRMIIDTPHESDESEPRDAAMSDGLPGALDMDLITAVATLTPRGWKLTYAGCIGPGAPRIAELTLPVGTRTAVMRLSSEPGIATPRVRASVVVSTPGYSTDADADSAISEPCFAANASPKGFSHSGIPTLGPTRMLPLLQ